MYKKNVIWLASYPKSGNTWFRVFLTNLLSDSDKPANINDLAESSISSSRKVFDDYTGIASSDLTSEEIDKLRPEVYKKQSEESKDLLFKKAHDKYYFVADDKALFPSEISKCAIYFARNPLDVLVSFAYHSSKPVNEMTKVLNDSKYAFCYKNNRLHNQLRQLLGTWSEHINSWTQQSQIPIQVVRYEDMINDTFSTFRSAVDFIGLNKDDNQIQDAIQKSEFSVLAKQEKEDGFREKMIKSTAFFRKGKIGDWRNHLNNELANEIISKNREVMQRLGYIDSNNELTF
jgi:hypothetical protein